MSDPNLWVPALLTRYARVLAQQKSPTPDALAALNSLQLADALLDKWRLNESHPQHPLQVAIIGPTQSGKSTLVNVLLDTHAASISALAGFTVHAQGYAAGYSEQALQPLHTMMAPLRRVPAASLSAVELDTYVLETVNAGPAALLNPAVVWDTPDFDSIDAGTYRRAVMNTVAIADIVILMVSKDKYGDKSVWDMLQLIHPLNQSTLVCINKLDPQDELAVMQAFTARYADQFGTETPPTILLPFVRRDDPQQRVLLLADKLQPLKQALQNARASVDRPSMSRSTTAFIERHCHQWLAPLLAEKLASDHWTETVERALERAEAHYASEYLNNPDKYDTFNRALAELLTLLEIPGLAYTLTRTRQLVTWPARKLLGVGRQALGRHSGSADYGATNVAAQDQEAVTLETILDSTLVTLQGELLDQPSDAFWRELATSFRQRQAQIRLEFLTRSETVRKEFEPQIEAAARRLYEQLQSQPALLNTLRAARVTADAAGVALALKSGGLAPADLVLAPAMLSVTTLLTESALGKYLDSVKAELRERQRQHINSKLFQGVLASELKNLPDALGHDTLFAQSLEPELRAVMENIDAEPEKQE